MNKHFQVIAFVLLAAQATHCALLATNLPNSSLKTPKDRKLIFTWDRDEEFNRREDRERCGFISQGGNGSTVQRDDAAAHHQDSAAADRV
jgi:hypothetical protein